MSKAFFAAVGAFAGSLVFAACVGDASTPSTIAPGSLNGPCLSNGTCNDGLFCDLVGSTGKCVPLDDGGGTDGATPSDSGGEAGLPVCSFTPTQYPCNGKGPACYGAAFDDCALTGCNPGDDQRWACFSPNQCNKLACCLPAATGTATAQSKCVKGALALADTDGGIGGGLAGTSCAKTTACQAGETQLCQYNDQCPGGQICTPVGIQGGPSAMNGIILGVCATP